MPELFQFGIPDGAHGGLILALAARLYVNSTESIIEPRGFAQ
jgi:hypothetical protein